MEVFRSLPHPPLARPVALSIGNFDGVHRGHQALLQAMMADARPRGWLAGLMTFDPHPLAVLRPQTTARCLSTIDERLALLEALGLDFVVVHPFSREVARTPAGEFVARLHESLRLAALWIGPDFALGRDREGNVPFLRELGRARGFEVHVLSPQMLAGAEVRSGTIREHLLAGEVAAAGEKLGHPYQISGQVVGGAQRGRTIGFPTANLTISENRLLPANGVYATWTQLPGRPALLPGVTNIGVRPSFDNGQLTVETHLLDFQGDLYGQQVTLTFVRRLRAEMRFASVDGLRAQIRQDIETARRVLNP